MIYNIALYLAQSHKLIVIAEEGGSESVVEAAKWWSLQEQFRNTQDKNIQGNAFLCSIRVLLAGRISVCCFFR